MDMISISGANAVSQWALFLGIGLIVFGIIEKRERFILAGQISFILLGCLASWILLSESIPVPTENSANALKELKTLAFFKGAVVMMAFATISMLLKLFKLPFQKASLFVLIFFALILFFMLFNIMQLPNIGTPKT